MSCTSSSYCFLEEYVVGRFNVYPADLDSRAIIFVDNLNAIPADPDPATYIVDEPVLGTGSMVYSDTISVPYLSSEVTTEGWHFTDLDVFFYDNSAKQKRWRLFIRGYEFHFFGFGQQPAIPIPGSTTPDEEPIEYPDDGCSGMTFVSFDFRPGTITVVHLISPDETPTY